MLPLFIGGAIQGGVGLVKMIAGAIKHASAKKEREAHAKNRPMYDIPMGMQRSLKIAQQMSAGDMPGYNRALENSMVNKADSMSNLQNVARGSADLLGASVASQGKAQDDLMNLASMNAQHKYSSLGNLASTQERMAGYQDKKWEYNEMQPWADKENELRNKQVTGEQGMYSGLNDMSAGAVNAFGDMFKSNMPQGTGPMEKAPMIKPPSGIYNPANTPSQILPPTQGVYDLNGLNQIPALRVQNSPTPSNMATISNLSALVSSMPFFR